MVARFIIYVVGASLLLAHIKAANFSQATTVGNIDDVELDEASGLAASRRFPGVLYTHNDHGGSPRVFAINASNAHVLVTFEISPAKNNDWEDIACGPCNSVDQSTCIYILDDGVNDSNDAKTIYKIREPDGLDHQTLVPQKLTFNWTEPHGSQSLMVDPSGELYVIGSVHGSRGMIVHVPSSAFGQETPVWVESTNFFAMESSESGPLGADISPSGQEVLVKNSEAIYYYSVPGQNYLEALKHQGISVPYQSEKKGESVCWAANGQSYYTLGEGNASPLYQYNRIDSPVIG